MKKGFTLIELIVVIAIIAVLSAIVAPNAFKAIEKAKVSRAMADAKTLRGASNAYYAELGFWPPDVCRGDDPGFMRSLPYNPDDGGAAHCIDVTGFPANWQALAQANWNGPYLEKWPSLTPWAGKYDWNFWPNGATRYGVTLPPGCYVGVQRDYNDRNPIPASSEQIMVNNDFDADNQVNGEVQLLMINF
jgi:general secretion pathway protein G